MIKRPTALYKNKVIGIESIYTVIDGKQINIAGKVEELKQKGANNELFCPCGCGSNLCVVASEGGLRIQHFRIKSNSNKCECSFIAEGNRSINSKIVLKCWLDEKIHDENLEGESVI